jgi:hypothetical protein
MRVAVVRNEKVVANAGDSSGTQRKGKVRLGKPRPSNVGEYVTVDTSACVVTCKV